MNGMFYDIESFQNVFSVAVWWPRLNHLYLFCHTDDFGDYPLNPWANRAQFEQMLFDRVREKNKNLPDDTRIFLYNLAEEVDNRRLFRIMSLSDAEMISSPDAKKTANLNDDPSIPYSPKGTHFPIEFRTACTTDDNYAQEEANNRGDYLIGYNSSNYDTTMLAIYGYECWMPLEPAPGAARRDIYNCNRFHPCSANRMRRHNDMLFTPEFKESMPRYLNIQYDYNLCVNKGYNYDDTRAKIRQNMFLTGRHLDLSLINEKQKRSGLKRLVGMQGGQILESEKLSQNQSVIRNLSELVDMLAYNVSDVVNLDIYLFRDTYYQAQIALKESLLTEYPELIYEKKRDAYAPNRSVTAVRKDRLCIDSSSAKFSAMTLCPYGHIKDAEVISFNYPSARRAAELGMQQFNVLEMARDYFYGLFPQPQLRAEFDRVYDYYKSIEGKNVNDSDNYHADYPTRMVDTIERRSIVLFYYRKDGTRSSCFANFSIGGIHGAECNIELFEKDRAEWMASMDLQEKAKALFPNPTDLHIAKKVTIDGTEYDSKVFLKAGATKTRADWKDLQARQPYLFKEKSGKLILVDRYARTSVGLSRHDDFESYYPTLLRMLDTFFNEGLGYDRYEEIFHNKQRYGVYMKDKNRDEQERTRYRNMREGTKLILNSASGVADSNFKTSIRANNSIVSMRLIGQLFSWMVGQAQAYEGADVFSTNTDGLYNHMAVPGFTDEENAAFSDRILEESAKNIAVNITPEPVFLISKDTNNRMDIDPETREITSAAGGDIGCRKGPTPTKALSHPAIIDWLLCQYMMTKAMDGDDPRLEKPFDYELGRTLLQEAVQDPDKIHALRMFQNVLASSPGSFTYVVGRATEEKSRFMPMQHYNRVFIMKDNTEHCMHLMTIFAKTITPVMKKKRERDGEVAIQNDLTAKELFAQFGITPKDIPAGTEMVFKKVTSLDPDWFMRVENRALCELSEEEQTDLLASLDLERYLKLAAGKYEDNWRNHYLDSPEETAPAEPADVPDDASETMHVVMDEDLLEKAMGLMAKAQPKISTDNSRADAIDKIRKTLKHIEDLKTLTGDKYMKKVPKVLEEAGSALNDAAILLQTEGGNHEETDKTEPVPAE